MKKISGKKSSLPENSKEKFQKKVADVLEKVESTFYLTCDDCKEKKKDVRETTCPFQYDVFGRDVPVKLCDVCYQSRAWDI